MASGTADLQDLGGALMQPILGSVLTSAYASSFASQIASNPEASQKVSESTQTQLERSFSSASRLPSNIPGIRTRPDVHAVQTAFPNGSDPPMWWGSPRSSLVRSLVFAFPKKGAEHALLAGFHAEDMGEPVPGAANCLREMNRTFCDRVGMTGSTSPEPRKAIIRMECGSRPEGT